MALRPKLIVSTILGTLAYLGLAILGLGGFAAFFSHRALIALTVVFFLLSAVAPFSPGNLSPGEREDRGNRWVLAAFGVISLLLGYVPAYDDRTELWTIDGDAVRWLGVVLFAAGGALRMWPVFVLGHRFSGLVAIQRGHTLVTHGVYGVIRHPAISVCSSARWAGRSHSVPGSACCSRRCSSRRCSRASTRKSGCCARTSATSTMPIAAARHGSSPAYISGLDRRSAGSARPKRLHAKSAFADQLGN